MIDASTASASSVYSGDQSACGSDDRGRGFSWLGGRDCALAGQALFRLELGKDDKVVNEEPLLMDLSARIRDVQVFADGAVYVLTEGANGKLLKMTPKTGSR